VAGPSGWPLGLLGYTIEVAMIFRLSHSPDVETVKLMMHQDGPLFASSVNRRSFLKGSTLLAAGIWPALSIARSTRADGSDIAQGQPATPALSPRRCKVLVLTGEEYPGHNWKATAPRLTKILSADSRLSATMNAGPEFLGSSWLPDYDVVLLNYMNWQSPGPGKAAQENLQKFVASGKGLVLVHFACGAFQDWPEFKNIAGRVWDPKLPGHDPYGPFTVEITDVKHPITQGMKSFETVDELYTCLAGDKEIQVLAKATSKVDKKDYPMAFVNHFGKGRVFHCVLGHDVAALTPEGVGELYRRGTAWAGGLPPVP
jgi:uncharacterized protein